MEHLPEELLLTIFRYTWHTDVRSFLNCLRTSKKWNRVGQTTLYTHVCTSADGNYLDVPLWTATFSTPLRAKNAMQSLTLTNITSLADLQDVELDPFLKALSEFPRLRSFSINSTLVEIPTSIYIHNCNDIVAPILKALPPTVVNLEVVVEPVNHHKPCNFRYHLCDIIASLVPQLESLRLQVPRLCPGFLHGSLSPKPTAADGSTMLMSKLRSASVWLKTQRIPSTEVRNCAADWPGIDAYSRTTELEPSKVARSVQQLYRDGSFPHLENFSILSREHRLWSVREVVSGTTLQACQPTTLVMSTNDGRGVRPGGRKIEILWDVWSQLEGIFEPGDWVTLCNKSRISQRSPATLDFNEKRDKFLRAIAEYKAEDMATKDVRDGSVNSKGLHYMRLPKADFFEGV